MSKPREGTYIVTQAANGVALYTNKDGLMLSCGSTPATRQASSFPTAIEASEASRSFTHKPQRGRPPQVVVVQVA